MEIDYFGQIILRSCPKLTTKEHIQALCGSQQM